MKMASEDRKKCFNLVRVEYLKKFIDPSNGSINFTDAHPKLIEAIYNLLKEKKYSESTLKVWGTTIEYLQSKESESESDEEKYAKFQEIINMIVKNMEVDEISAETRQKIKSKPVDFDDVYNSLYKELYNSFERANIIFEFCEEIKKFLERKQLPKSLTQRLLEMNCILT